MIACQNCKKSLSFITLLYQKHPNPLGSGYLCRKCHEPYGLFSEKFTTNLKNVERDPKATAWVALCCLMAAKRINLMRTTTAAISGFVEKQDSWKVCKEKAMSFATKAMYKVPRDSGGYCFLEALHTEARNITTPPTWEIRIQRYASVLGDRILDIEYEAIMRIGATQDEFNALAMSMPCYQWLLSESGAENL